MVFALRVCDTQGPNKEGSMVKRASTKIALFILAAAVIFSSCAPKITGFDPKTGGEGTDVTIQGEHFSSNAAENIVRSGGVRTADLLAAQEDRLVVKVPIGAKMGRISVETKNGKGESEADFMLLGKGYALAVGLNAVDPGKYAGWNGSLTGCEPDAKDMEEIAKRQGFETELLLTAGATREAVLESLKKWAEKCRNGDLLVVSYSGHGGQVPDQNGDETDDGLDETWCLFDGQLLDDELYEAWTKFREGVRILAFSDSCHSGTILKMIKSDFLNPPQTRIGALNEKWEKKFMTPMVEESKIRALGNIKPELAEKIIIPGSKNLAEDVFSRSVPPDIMSSVYHQNLAFYETLGARVPKENVLPVLASAILIAGCEDFQTAMDMVFNGLFTVALKKVWQNGDFAGNHLDFHKAIKDKVRQVNSQQSPKFFTIGAPYEAFVRQKPYTIVRS